MGFSHPSESLRATPASTVTCPEIVPVYHLHHVIDGPLTPGPGPPQVTDTGESKQPTAQTLMPHGQCLPHRVLKRGEDAAGSQEPALEITRQMRISALKEGYPPTEKQAGAARVGQYGGTWQAGGIRGTGGGG